MKSADRAILGEEINWNSKVKHSLGFSSGVFAVYVGAIWVSLPCGGNP